MRELIEEVQGVPVGRLAVRRLSLEEVTDQLHSEVVRLQDENDALRKQLAELTREGMGKHEILAIPAEWNAKELQFWVGEWTFLIRAYGQQFFVIDARKWLYLTAGGRFSRCNNEAMLFDSAQAAVNELRRVLTG